MKNEKSIVLKLLTNTSFMTLVIAIALGTGALGVYLDSQKRKMADIYVLEEKIANLEHQQKQFESFLVKLKIQVHDTQNELKKLIADKNAGSNDKSSINSEMSKELLKVLKKIDSKLPSKNKSKSMK